jgi:hypothetical protein
LAFWRFKILKNHSLHKDMMVVRQVLKHAIEEGHIAALPVIPKVGKIEANPRPWLTHAEWDRLIDLSMTRVQKAKGNPRLEGQRQDLFDFMVFMMESMMRVNELRERGASAADPQTETPARLSAYRREREARPSSNRGGWNGGRRLQESERGKETR